MTTPIDRTRRRRFMRKAGPRHSSAAAAAAPTATAATAVESRDLPSQRLEQLRSGLRAMAHEHLEEARVYLSAAAAPTALGDTDPVAVDALAYLSSVAYNLGDFQAAAEAVELAVSLGPDRFAPNQKAGELALRLGDMDRAVDLFLSALRATDPGTSDAKAAEASLRECRRRLSKGIKHGTTLPSGRGLLRHLTPWQRREQPDEELQQKALLN